MLQRRHSLAVASSINTKFSPCSSLRHIEETSTSFKYKVRQKTKPKNSHEESVNGEPPQTESNDDSRILKHALSCVLFRIPEPQITSTMATKNYRLCHSHGVTCIIPRRKWRKFGCDIVIVHIHREKNVTDLPLIRRSAREATVYRFSFIQKVPT